jgi:hypothetical protein
MATFWRLILLAQTLLHICVGERRKLTFQGFSIEKETSMMQLLQITLVGLGLIWGGMAYAASPSGVGPTAAGYYFTASTNARVIYVYPSVQPSQGSNTADTFPPSATLTVEVKNASGQPVPGVPVAIEVAQDSTLQGMLNITPQQSTTGEDGMAHITVQPSSSATTGAGQVMARVDDMTQTVGLAVELSRVRGQN